MTTNVYIVEREMIFERSICDNFLTFLLFILCFYSISSFFFVFDQ